MAGDFILIIIITFGFGDNTQTIKLNFPKASLVECMIEAEKIAQDIPFVTVETKCESILAFPHNENGDSIST